MNKENKEMDRRQLETIETIRKVIVHLKIIRKTDRITFRNMIEDGSFYEEAIKPLEGLVNWSAEDENYVIKMAKKFTEETEGKTFEEKRKKLNSIKKKALIAGGIGAALLGIGIAAYTLIKKDGDSKDEDVIEKTEE